LPRYPPICAGWGWRIGRLDAWCEPAVSTASISADMQDALPRVAVLASGAGSTLHALIEAQCVGQLPVQFVGLFSDKPAAPALEHALRAGMPVCALSPKGFANRAAHDAALFARVAESQPDLVICAGYMRIIEA
jgi:folate-dependent phosphoribosylglycinamide formyltransferase PurN